MYRITYKYKETEENKVLVEKEYFLGVNFRLKRNAVKYLLDIIQNEYREKGYGTEQLTGGAIYCYKSELTTENKRKEKNWIICIKRI